MTSAKNLLRFALATAFSSLGHLAGAQASTHVENVLGWSRAPVSNTALDARLAGAAAQYRSYAPIPRVAFYDIAYPKDSAEAVAMNGNAVLVVTAVVQDSSECPLRRVYLTAATGTQELLLVSAVASYTVDTNVRATFGPFRLDAAYLLQLAIRTAAGDLLADFAAHRLAFRLTHFDGQTPEPVRRLGRLAPGSGLPGPAAIWTLVRREYPDLAGRARATLGARTDMEAFRNAGPSLGIP